MFNIRKNVFETNSSSSHSIAINELGTDEIYTSEEARAELKDCIENNVLDLSKLDSEYTEFGWGVDIYSDFVHKMSYALIELYKGENDVEYPDSDFNTFVNWLKEFLNIDDIIYPGNEDKSWSNTAYNFGSIDHQSVGTLFDALENDEDEHSVIDFVINKNILLIIDNDNH